MKIKTALIVSIAFLAIGFSAVGRYNAAKLTNMANIQAHPNDITNNSEIDTASEFDTAGEDTNKRAEKIAHAVAEIEGIEKVSVIITGNSAIIGIEVKGELTDGKLIELKKKAEGKAKSAESSLDHVGVTAGPELIKRIEHIADFSWTPEKTSEVQNGLNIEQEKLVDSLTPAL